MFFDFTYVKYLVRAVAIVAVLFCFIADGWKEALFGLFFAGTIIGSMILYDLHRKENVNREQEK